MGIANVWILGGYQSDFARNLTREGHDFADLTAEVVATTLVVAKVDACDIEVVHVANAFGEMFARQGLDEAHLHAIAQLNFANARSNPNAQTRNWTVPDPIGADEANPPIEGRLRRFDCSQMTDGGAGIVLVTDEYLRNHPGAQPIG